MDSVYGDTSKFILERCPFKIHRPPKHYSQCNYRRFKEAKELRKFFKDVRFIEAASEELPVGGERTSESGITYYVFVGNHSFRPYRWGGK